MDKITKGVVIAAAAVMLTSCGGGGLSEKDRNAYEKEIERHSRLKDASHEGRLKVLKLESDLMKLGRSPRRDAQGLTTSEFMQAKYAYHEEMDSCLGEYMEIDEPLAKAKTDCTLRAGGEPLS